MNTSQLKRRLEATLETCRFLLETVADPRRSDGRPIDRIDLIAQRISDASTGPKASSTEARVSTSGTNDPVYDSLVEQGTVLVLVDRALVDQDRLAEAVWDMWKLSGPLHSLGDRWAPARPLDPAQLRKLQSDGMDDCVLHLEVGHHTVSLYPTDFKSVLGVDNCWPEPKPVCSPCIHRVKNTGRLPSKEELAYHSRTGRWNKGRAA